ncbi:hypothetical protein PPERSA_04794 [Pseudocohnilembus persalinus]|uniref:Uncharacterized protein n=1 Tax=Pseudocohnilembus persalinus TaxID=266149 RepID=A0A0V0Q9G7_PSEPJ|nr:hypothetical protein PPERSA_04794 [Pseudocohnilembus persalinus]|eukprot:KRW98861.1 hypothetical protein PPERSA_04794 [Pseudocohnilembus persalinus]
MLYQKQSMQKQQSLKNIYDEQQSVQNQYKQKKETNSILKNNMCNNFANFSEEKYNIITVKDYEGDLSWMTQYVIQNCEVQQLLDYQGTLEKNEVQSYINKLNLFQMLSNFNQNQFRFSKPFSSVNNQDKNQLETKQCENNISQSNKLNSQDILYKNQNKIEIDENKNNSEFYIENKDILENKQQTHNENNNDEINLLQQEYENQDEQQKLKLKQYIQQQNLQFQQNSSKFHNKNKQFINCIIRFFCQENLDMIKITNNLKNTIFKFLDDCRKTGIQYRERKKIEKTDKFSHSHYRLLFLTLNPESVQKICHIKQDFKLHKNLLDINLKYCAQSEEYYNEESIQQKINFINFLKRCIFEITMRFVYKKFQTCKKLWHTEYDYEYKAFQGLQQLINGNCVMRF